MDKRLDSISWALFLIMIGGLWLFPKEQVPEGSWLIGTGLIILGLTVVRYFNSLKIKGFWVFLGFLALGSGLSGYLGLNLPVFPILLIIMGVLIILGPILKKARG